MLVITKDEPFQPVSRKEKDRIIDDYVKITSKGGYGWSKDEVERAANFPRNRPFFRGILTDDEGRIYIKKVRSVLEEGEETEYDIFSRDGDFLCSARLPFAPLDIRAGRLYSIHESDETGEVRVIRHKISNWKKLQSSVIRSS